MAKVTPLSFFSTTFSLLSPSFQGILLGSSLSASPVTLFILKATATLFLAFFTLHVCLWYLWKLPAICRAKRREQDPLLGSFLSSLKISQRWAQHPASKRPLDSPGLFAAFLKSKGLKSSPSLQYGWNPCSILSTDLLGLLQVLFPLTVPDFTARLGSYSSNWPLEYAADQPYRECRTFTRSLSGLSYMDLSFPL